MSVSRHIWYSFENQMELVRLMAEPSGMEGLLARRDRARERFATLRDSRPGTLVENYRKCGKPNCHCAREGDPGHGPSYVLARSVGGEKRAVRVRGEELDETRRLVDEYRRFRELSAELLDASEALAAARSKAGREGRDSRKRGLPRPRSRRR